MTKGETQSLLGFVNYGDESGTQNLVMSGRHPPLTPENINPLQTAAWILGLHHRVLRLP